MTVGEMLKRMDSRELTQQMAYDNFYSDEKWLKKEEKLIRVRDAIQRNKNGL